MERWSKWQGEGEVAGGILERVAERGMKMSTRGEENSQPSMEGAGGWTVLDGRTFCVLAHCRTFFSVRWRTVTLCHTIWRRLSGRSVDVSWTYITFPFNYISARPIGSSPYFT
jgi:hypothetical protein